MKQFATITVIGRDKTGVIARAVQYDSATFVEARRFENGFAPCRTGDAGQSAASVSP